MIEILHFATPDTLAAAVAARFVDEVAEVQAGGGVPSVVLTGGTIAGRIHEAVTTAPGALLVDWATVDFWFGDERYVERDSPDRNVRQAKGFMLDHLPGVGPRVHEMPWADGEYGDDVEAAAAAHARELAESLGSEPTFDILMLGIGPDGHCASLFPGHPEVTAPESVLAVRNSPKPPPLRISLGMSVLMRAREVWFVAAGADKAQAAAAVISETDVNVTPACGPKGLQRTLFFVDEGAASLL